MKKFALDIKKLFHKIRPLIGLPLVYAGCLLSALLYAFNLTNNNIVLLLPAIMILAGIVGQICRQKSEDNY